MPDKVDIENAQRKLADMGLLLDKATLRHSNFSLVYLHSIKLIQGLVFLLTDRVSGLTSGGSSGEVYTENYDTFRSFNAQTVYTVKDSAGKLYALTAYNRTPEVRYIQIFDYSTSLDISDEPLESHPVFPESFLVLDNNYFGKQGQLLNNGIVYAISLANNIFKTDAETANLDIHIKYI